MAFKLGHEVPDNLRPFIPFIAEENTSSEISLNKNISPRVYTLLVVALINLLPIIVFPDFVLSDKKWIYYSGFLIFLFSASLHLIEDRYSKIVATISGITLVRKILFINITTFIKRQDIQSIQYHQKRLTSNSAHGRIIINMVHGNKKTLSDIYRSTIDDASKDIRTIASNIAGVLSISDEAVVTSSKYVGAG